MNFPERTPGADDFERAAMAFRPSWELDDAPFTGSGTLTASDIRALALPEPVAPMVAPVPEPWAPLPSQSVRAPVIDAESSASFVRPSRRPLWIGVGGIVVALAGAGLWAMSGRQEKRAPALEATPQPVENAKLYAIPAPPPETTTDSPAPVDTAPRPATIAAASAPPTARPAAAPPPVAAHAAPAARSAYASPARPSARKAPNIVRDAPF